MNIEDYKGQPCTLEEVFARQRELKFKFEPDSEELFKNFDIDVYEDQEQFKRYCWRVTEELCEAHEAWLKNDRNHFYEEIIDGFNFLVELMLLYGWTEKDVDPLPTLCTQKGWNDLPRVLFSEIYAIGLTANLLKNRQWRQSQYMTDLLMFERRLKSAWTMYLDIFIESGLSSMDVTVLYDRKNKVNNFRIETNY